MKGRMMVYFDGFIAGIIGAAVVAIWFLFLDTVSGLPFYAPTVLGTALFLGPEDLASTEAVQLSLNLTLMYTWVHVLAFVMLGEIAAYLLFLTGQNPNLGFCIFLFTLLELGFVGIVFVFAEPVLDQLAWPAVLLGNLLAAGAMVCYFRLRQTNLIAGLELAHLNQEPSPSGASAMLDKK
jgi:hypothetical protein